MTDPAPWAGLDPNDPLEDLHGGDLGWAADAYRRHVSDWLDLSTGINWLAYTVPPVPDAAWRELPAKGALEGLCAAAADVYGAGAGTAVVAAPGTQAIIQAPPALNRPARVTILGPTYFEHEKCWRGAGVPVEASADLPPLDRSVVVDNPNNPDGRIVSPERLADWAGRAARAGHVLIVDEAFADVTPEVSLAPHLPLPNVVVLRSFGKFYCLAGLRLGFALGGDRLIRDLEARLGPWAVSGPALAVRRAAFADAAWAAEARRRLAGDRAQLESMIAGAGLDIAGSTDLFVLGAGSRAPLVWEALARSDILVRRFIDRPDYLRFGLPGPEDEWRRLADALNGGAAGR
ncbi:MAG: threonine-phosphate decarboxylase CobD [Rhodospirillaceae bacterium]